ncbi:hypothetical protein GCM10023238_06670 [Streptomyces heliomycini]
MVRGGVVLLDGVPLHASPAWRAEERAAPRSVAEALAPLPTADVPLEAVRQGPIALAAGSGSWRPADGTRSATRRPTPT